MFSKLRNSGRFCRIGGIADIVALLTCDSFTLRVTNAK